MPRENQFRHQTYSADATFANYQLVSPEVPPRPGEAGFENRLAAVGQRFEELGISVIGLMHGTFVGSDAFGIAREIGRWAPGLGERLRQGGKELTDRFAGETGNFTPEFAKLLQTHLNRDTASPIEVTTFDWSSENNHTGRADGAIRLIDSLLDRRISAQDRFLLLGHSHAGNVFALVTNLLATDQQMRDRFFDATQTLYQYKGDSNDDVIDLPVWERVRNRLAVFGDKKWNLDLVTFGTPVRYGWDTGCIKSLTHFIHHHPTEGLPVYRAPFPPILSGDIIQQIGIAGTDFLPYMLSRRTRLAEQKLNRLLQPELRRR
ncbi:MAG: hypothetical protein KDB27_19085, partial [Planctomycetales bacterium]|nr:hypothetical protein [Planctomycetales bacterium]